MEKNKVNKSVKVNKVSKLSNEIKVDKLPKQKKVNNLPKDNESSKSSRSPDVKPILEVINLSKQYKRKDEPAISNLSFKVYPGQFHAFIGANGAGKTTTLKSIIGALANYSGEIKLGGINNNLAQAKKNIGYIPEVNRFPKILKCSAYLVAMAKLSGLSTGEAKKFAKKTLDEMGMSNLAKKKPAKFSSGQQKKILMAQALVHNPRVLIMDEPAANLDPTSRVQFFNLLKKKQIEQNVSIFISSHILTELNKYVDSVTIIDGGKIVYSGPADHNLEELYNRYVKKGSVSTMENKDMSSDNAWNL